MASSLPRLAQHWLAQLVRRKPHRGTVVLDRRRIYILPTREGWLFGLVLIAMLLGAINYNNGLAYALTFLLAGLALVSILHAFRNLNGLALRAGSSRPVFAGESAVFPVTLDNRQSRPRPAVLLNLTRQAPQLVDLVSGESKTVELRAAAAKRGRLAMGRTTVSTRYPLGLFRAWSPLDFDGGALIYPRPAPPSGLPGVEQRYDAMAGEGCSGEEDFSNLRSYRAGDSFRRIAWKAVAKERGLLTKQFAGGGAVGSVWLEWDRAEGETEQRLSRLCRWVLEAEAAGLTYGLALPDRRIPPGRGDNHRHRCLEALALYGEPQ